MGSNSQVSLSHKSVSGRLLAISVCCCLIGLISITEHSTLVVAERGQISIQNKNELDRIEAKEFDEWRAQILNQTTLDEEYFDQIASFYNSLENEQQRQGRQRLSEIVNDELLAKLHTITYSDLYFHRYDNHADLLESGGPLANQELCLGQLRQLIKRAKVSKFERFASKDININVLLDTFGRIPSGMLEGNVIWLGSYDECMRIKISLNEGESDPRYCLSSFRLNEWPARKTELLDELAVLKAGVCLPKSCDSINYKNKYQLIHKLLELNDNQLDFKSFNLTQLYCLPDAESSLRIWWRVPKTLLVVCLLASWLVFLFYATIKHHMLTHRKFNNNYNNSKTKQLKFYESLSLIQNAKFLFSTSKDPTPQILATNVNNGNDSATNKSEELTIGEKQQPQQQQQQQQLQPEVIVDLAPIEGIKVICMFHIVMGHALFCGAANVENWREYFSLGNTFKIFNVFPTHTVNSYFVITGFLTAYFLFKQNTLIRSISQPRKWFAFVVLKYIKIVPIALIILAYIKHLSRFIGSGPLWDYGTSSLAQRKACLEESWIGHLLLIMNFKTKFHFCISPSWYLANDFQFALVTPPLLALLYKRPNFGKLLICLGIVASVIKDFAFVYNSELKDMRPIVNVLAHSFNMSTRYIIASYFRPEFRIPAFLIGLLLGISLDSYEKGKRNWFARQKQKCRQQHQEHKLKKSDSGQLREFKFRDDERPPSWYNWFVRYAPTVSVFFILYTALIVPFQSRGVVFTKNSAKLTLAIAIPAFKIVYSLAIGSYLLLATTGNGFKLLNRFLAHKIWKPFARLNLCVMLSNMEVIFYVLGAKSRILHFDDQHFLEMGIYCYIVTYIVSAVLFVVFELPIRAIFKHLIVHPLTAGTVVGMSRTESNSRSIKTK